MEEMNSKIKKLKVLYIIGVENSQRNVTLMKKNYDKLKIYDKITFCFNHFDGENTEWEKEDWYNNLNCIKNIGIGSKITQWLKITPDIAKNYDYLWFSDGDIGLKKFDWKIYESMLINMKPLLSQPAVIAGETGRASDHKHLCYTNKKKNSIYICKKNIEIMTPFISTKIWRLIYEKMKFTDKRSDWKQNIF